MDSPFGGRSGAMTSSVLGSVMLKEQIEFNQPENNVAPVNTNPVDTNVNFRKFENNFEHLNLLVNNNFENMIVFEKFKNLNKINCTELSNSSRGGCDVPLSIEIDKSLCQAPHTSVAQNEPSELPNHVNMARIEPEQSEPNNFSR